VQVLNPVVLSVTHQIIDTLTQHVTQLVRLYGQLHRILGITIAIFHVSSHSHFTMMGIVRLAVQLQMLQEWKESTITVIILVHYRNIFTGMEVV
jgi:hypothetical protein